MAISTALCTHDWIQRTICVKCGIVHDSNEYQLDILIKEAMGALAKLTPEQQQAMWEEQRQSWVRAEQGMKD